MLVIVLYFIVFFCDSLYCILLYSIVIHCIVFYCILLYSIVIHCIVFYCIVIYSIVLFCILLCCDMSFVRFQNLSLYCHLMFFTVMYCIQPICTPNQPTHLLPRQAGSSLDSQHLTWNSSKEKQLIIKNKYQIMFNYEWLVIRKNNSTPLPH